MDTDVLVVGAGPTGLMLAGDLARGGVRCILLERRTDEANTTRAFAVHARTLEELDARGVADKLIATGTTVLGATIVHGARLASLSQTAGEVTATTEDGRIYTARYLVGCDGVRSAVRD